MNKFVIVDGLPFLLADGKTYACRFDEKGFTLGAEVHLHAVPRVTHSALAIMAQCSMLDSIAHMEQKAAGSGRPKGRKKNDTDG